MITAMCERPAETPLTVARIPVSTHGHVLDRSTLRYSVTLPPVASSVPLGRAETSGCLTAWEFGRTLIRNAELAVSELITNAVYASALLPGTPDLHLAIAAGNSSRRPGFVVIAVADASDECPVLRMPTGDSPHGRGLRIVEAVSNNFGWYPIDFGKCIWAEWICP